MKAYKKEQIFADYLLDEIVTGLLLPQKKISPKYLYDDLGSELFERICQQPEYYQARTEASILREHINEIKGCLKSKEQLVEYGSGSSTKTRILLKELGNIKTYIPIDISEHYLKNACRYLKFEFPMLKVKPLVCDYMTSLLGSILKVYDCNSPAFFFPGSTIGNLEPEEAVGLLGRTRKIFESNTVMIIGVDLKKDKKTLEAAYNDSSKVTEAFNLNLLTCLNREFGSNFDVSQFSHLAYYNEEKGRIEMHLVSKRKQTVCLANHNIVFKKNERLHTENSYKYTISEFHTLAKAAGYGSLKSWADPNQMFSVHYLA